jgi:hypothetical protein
MSGYRRDEILGRSCKFLQEKSFGEALSHKRAKSMKQKPIATSNIDEKDELTTEEASASINSSDEATFSIFSNEDASTAHHSNRESLKIMRKGLAHAQPVRVCLRNYRKNGEMFTNLLMLKPIVDEFGEYIYGKRPD